MPRGFSFLEILLTIIVISIIVSAGSVFLSGVSSDYHIKTRSDSLGLFLNTCESHARMRGITFKLVQTGKKLIASDSANLFLETNSIATDSLKVLTDIVFSPAGAFLGNERISSKSFTIIDKSGNNYFLKYKFKEMITD
ncbi:MAG: prepilin-type N-terminal cleavage/methylation domain-containing protein [Candidatus Riflebacteria bacterium]|nr:prepilin-type N-terminal cleavage/methylation domain-containing protein [Candidatus Riflebacteria bacterium]